MTHKCPRVGCIAQVPDDQLACPAHWHQLPGAVKRSVSESWDRGRGRGTRAHRLAVRYAIRVMNRGQD